MLTLAADDPRAVAAVTSIREGNVETLQRLLRDDPALGTARIVDHRGVSRTLLHVVADWPGHVPNGARSVDALVAAGAEVDARVTHAGGTGSPETALHWAASSDDVAVLDALLDGGADIEAPGAVLTGGPPMSDAVVFAQWRAAHRLLARGAATTIWQAAALGLMERLHELCAAEPSPDQQQISNALWHACRGGRQAAAAYLLDRGAELNRVGHDHKTPYDVAQESGDAAFVEWLRARGAAGARDLR